LRRIKPKIQTARRIYTTSGLRGITSTIFLEKFPGPIFAAFYSWLKKNNWWVGKFIEITGDTVLIDGCRFSVRSPVIPTKLKSRFLFNQYEPSERLALRRFLDPSLPVIEFGGSVGVVACLTNKLLENPRDHVVVEANPDLVPLLQSNRDRNGCQFTVVNKAIAYGSSHVEFFQNQDFLSSSIQSAAEQKVSVPAITLRDVVNQFGFDRFTLICDIEGGEVELVEHDGDIFRTQVKTLIIEVHEAVVGTGPIRSMLQKLQEYGFEALYKDWDTYALENRTGPTESQFVHQVTEQL